MPTAHPGGQFGNVKHKDDRSKTCQYFLLTTRDEGQDTGNTKSKILFFSY